MPGAFVVMRANCSQRLRIPQPEGAHEADVLPPCPLLAKVENLRRTSLAPQAGQVPGFVPAERVNFSKTRPQR